MNITLSRDAACFNISLHEFAISAEATTAVVDSNTWFFFLQLSKHAFHSCVVVTCRFTTDCHVHVMRRDASLQTIA